MRGEPSAPIAARAGADFPLKKTLQMGKLAFLIQIRGSGKHFIKSPPQQAPRGRGRRGGPPQGRRKGGVGDSGERNPLDRPPSVMNWGEKLFGLITGVRMCICVCVGLFLG